MLTEMLLSYVRRKRFEAQLATTAGASLLSEAIAKAQRDKDKVSPAQFFAGLNVKLPEGFSW